MYLAPLPEEGRLPGPRQDEGEVLEQNSPEQGWAETKTKVFHNLLLALAPMMDENIKSPNSHIKMTDQASVTRLVCFPFPASC